MKNVLFCLIICISLLAITGCTKNDGLSGLVPCKGTLTLDDVPVEGVSITFVPEKLSEKSKPASATTDSQGKFVTLTLKPDDGIYPGNKYKVTLTKMEAEGKVPTQAEIDEANATGKSLPNVSYKNVMPKKYWNTDTTDIEITIPDKGDERLELKAVSK